MLQYTHEFRTGKVASLNVLKVIRRFTVIGAAVVIFSFILRWEIITGPTSATTLGSRPVPVLIIGLALFLLSVLPALPRWYNLYTLVLLTSALIAVVVILWAITDTVMTITRTNLVEFGPGPIIALVGVVIYLAGALVFLQGDPEEEKRAKKPNYKIIMTEKPPASDSEAKTPTSLLGDEPV